MSKFISFLSLEDRKGKDKFNVHRFVLFKVCDSYVSYRAMFKRKQYLIFFAVDGGQ